jgi:hypothetical protein
MVSRLKLALLGVLALAVLAFAGNAAAGAQINPLWTAQDPQTANIPYLAWAGNQVKITKCFSAGLAGGDIES